MTGPQVEVMDEDGTVTTVGPGVIAHTATFNTAKENQSFTQCDGELDM